MYKYKYIYIYHMFNSKHVGFNQQQEWYHGNIMRDIGNICNMTLWCLQQLVILKGMAGCTRTYQYTMCKWNISNHKLGAWNLNIKHWDQWKWRFHLRLSLFTWLFNVGKSWKTYIVEHCQQTIGHSPKNGWLMGSPTHGLWSSSMDINICIG